MQKKRRMLAMLLALVIMITGVFPSNLVFARESGMNIEETHAGAEENAKAEANAGSQEAVVSKASGTDVASNADDSSLPTGANDSANAAGKGVNSGDEGKNTETETAVSKPDSKTNGSESGVTGENASGVQTAEKEGTKDPENEAALAGKQEAGSETDKTDGEKAQTDKENADQEKDPSGKTADGTSTKDNSGEDEKSTKDKSGEDGKTEKDPSGKIADGTSTKDKSGEDEKSTKDKSGEDGKTEKDPSGKDGKTTDGKSDKDSKDTSGDDQKTEKDDASGKDEQESSAGKKASSDGNTETAEDEDVRKTLVYDGLFYYVQVSYGKDAGVPDGAYLEVEELTANDGEKKPSAQKLTEAEKKEAERIRDKYIRLAEETLEEDSEDLYIRLFDIKILDNKGKEVALKDSVEVSIRMIAKEGIEEDEEKKKKKEDENFSIVSLTDLTKKGTVLDEVAVESAKIDEKESWILPFDEEAEQEDEKLAGTAFDEKTGKYLDRTEERLEAEEAAKKKSNVEKEEEKEVIGEGLQLTFEAKKNAVFAVAQTVKEKIVTASDGKEYIVKVTYDNLSGIPFDAELSVKEIKKGEAGYKKYVAATAEALGEKPGDLTFARAFDIKLKNPKTGKEYQPANEVTVSVKLLKDDLDKYENLDVVHIPDGAGKKAEVLENTVQKKAIEFASNGFSVYVIYFTLNWDDYSYSIEAGSELLLSDLLKELGVTAITIDDVKAVSFSKEELMTVESLEGDWKLTSLTPITTEETLTLTLNNDLTVEIAVTGAEEEEKAEPEVTAPTPKEGLVYNGQSQILVSAGTTTGGTLQYSLSEDGEYSRLILSVKDKITHTGAAEGNTYYDKVRAIDADGNAS